MRTKTLLLTAFLTAVGSAAVMAQTNVYSLNAVGYVNVTIAPDTYAIVANQLNSTNNTVGSLLNDANGTYDGLTVYKFNGVSYNTDFGNSIGSTFANGWNNGGTNTMNPGEAVFMKNGTASPISMTFVGTVPTGSLSVTLAGSGSYSLVSSPVPQAGDLCSNLSFTNFNNGDSFYIFNTNQTYTVYTVNEVGGSVGYNQDFIPLTGEPQDPTVSVAQGFFYKTSATGGAVTWTRNFSVND
jgi:hypothetical protein